MSFVDFPYYRSCYPENLRASVLSAFLPFLDMQVMSPILEPITGNHIAEYANDFGGHADFVVMNYRAFSFGRNADIAALNELAERNELLPIDAFAVELGVPIKIDEPWHTFRPRHERAFMATFGEGIERFTAQLDERSPGAAGAVNTTFFALGDLVAAGILRGVFASRFTHLVELSRRVPLLGFTPTAEGKLTANLLGA